MKSQKVAMEPISETKYLVSCVPQCPEEDFVEFLLGKLQDEGRSPEKIISCELRQHSNGDTVARLQVEDSSAAQDILLLNGTEFGSTVINFTREDGSEEYGPLRAYYSDFDPLPGDGYNEVDEANSPPPVPVPIAQTKVVRCAQDTDYSASDMTQDENSDTPPTSPSKKKKKLESQPFSSSASVETYLHILIAKKEEVPMKMWEAETWSDIRSNLRKNGIHASVSDCKSKKKYLDDYFRRQRSKNMTSWRFYEQMSQLHADALDPSAGVTVLKKTCTRENLEEDEDDPSVEPIVFENGQRWSHPATVNLITLWGERKTSFEDDRTAHRKLWREISVALCIDGFAFSPQQCERKMQAVKDEFNKIVDEENKSGRGKSKYWPYYDIMYVYSGKSATCRPKSTVAVGAVQLQKRSDVREETNGYSTATSSSGNTRKLSLSERKVVAAEVMATALRDLTNHYKERNALIAENSKH